MIQETVTVARDVWFRVVMDGIKASQQNAADAALLDEASGIIESQQEIINEQRALLDRVPQEIKDTRRAGQEDVLEYLRRYKYSAPFYGNLHGIAAADILRRFIDRAEAEHEAAHANGAVSCPLEPR